MKNEKNLIFNFGEDLDLEAQSSFMEGNSQGNNSNLKFEWELDNNFKEIFEIKNLNLNESSLKIKKEDYFLRSKNTLNEGKEILFQITLKISFIEIKTEKKLFLKIKFNKEEKKEIYKIESVYNPNNLEFLKFSPVFIEQNFPLQEYNFLWTISDFNNKEEFYLTGRRELNLKIKTTDLIEKNNNVTLSLINKKSEEVVFTNFYIFSKFEPPFAGTFIVTPAIGISLKTSFKFTLKNWKTNTRFLTFRIFFKDEKDKVYDITNENLVLAKLFLENINEASFEFISSELPVTETLYAEIKDSLGFSIIVSYAVKIIKNSNPPAPDELLSKIPESDIINYSKMNYILQTNLDTLDLKLPPNLIKNALDNLENSINSVEISFDSEKQVKIFSEISNANSDNSNKIFDVLMNVGDAIISKINPAENLAIAETIYNSLEGIGNSLSDVSGEERLDKILKTENLEKSITEKLLENILPGENLIIENSSYQSNVNKFSKLNPQKLDVAIDGTNESQRNKRNKRYFIIFFIILQE